MDLEESAERDKKLFNNFSEEFLVCLLHIFDPDTGEELKESVDFGRSLPAIGKLLFPEGEQQGGDSSIHIEVDSLVMNAGVEGIFEEVLSGREVLMTLEGLRKALQDLGFFLPETTYFRILESVQKLILMGTE